ncbi:hypothetical protein ACLIOB_003431 [Vibrio cholerae]|uniref:hypothetical protein n=1 Tax=Vibrio cholerae TaxID=666 RepID=UPI000A11A040|nr:hypothetical protein [Vibrio cholerae]EGQ8224983.1 hypothetical protein [Vibrio cholerae]MCU4218760.1 hypothetical protein [Vibrio cholerae]ORP14623.1 hypothetical protein B7978_08560 [Vibrio cholerae]SNC57671.1 Uncharacterised protein [Vibrio cholerae]HCZ9577687.1 hypothetical protein [Vibrio cholerae]
MTDKKLERSEEFIIHDLAVLTECDKWKKYCRVTANAMSVIPWVGSILASGAAAHGEKSQGQVNALYEEWLQVHKTKIELLAQSLDEVTERLESIPEEFEARIQSEQYLGLVRRAFRSWDTSDTAEKRQYVVNLISNAAASNICPDDQIRLFNDWLDTYHEIHFKVIRSIYQKPGITRLGIWQSVSDIVPRENSAEADLFKLLIRDLSTGSVIRQFRPINTQGQFVKQTHTTKRSGSGSNTMESAFENTKQYELTELGSQFVHYTMNQVVKRLES